MINAKLSKQRFSHCHENRLIKTIQTIPHNLCVGGQGGQGSKGGQGGQGGQSGQGVQLGLGGQGGRLGQGIQVWAKFHLFR